VLQQRLGVLVAVALIDVGVIRQGAKQQECAAHIPCGMVAIIDAVAVVCHAPNVPPPAQLAARSPEWRGVGAANRQNGSSSGS